MLVIAGWIYLPLVAAIKLSCLLFYWRVFGPSRTWKWVIGGSMCLLIVTYIALFFANLFECSPIEKNWNPLLRHGKCIPSSSLPYSSGVINVVSDLCVLIIPIPAVWSLNMKVQRKLRLIAIFSLAIL